MISLTKHKPHAEAVAATTPAAGRQANAVRTTSVPLEGGIYAISGVLKFATVADLKDHLKGLLELYRKEHDKTTEVIGKKFRTLGDEASTGTTMTSWEKVGGLYVDFADAEKGELDVALQLLSELKPKIAKMEEVVQDFKPLEDMPLKVDSKLLLYLRNGMPERIIVDGHAPENETFKYSEEYELE